MNRPHPHPLAHPHAALALALAALACAAAALPAAAAFDADSARAKAHALTPVLLAGRSAEMWAQFDGGMRSALGDSVRWAESLPRILGGLGALDSITGEEMRTQQRGAFVYVAHCAFARASGPIQLLIAFDEAGRVSGLLFRPEPQVARREYASPHLDYHTKAAMHLPFRGEWTVFWGGRTLAENYHAFTRDQRFALDLVIARDGATHRGDGRACADYWCWDQPVLAPAAGTVAWVRDSLPDNEPGHMDPANPTGNSLVLDLGSGEFVLIAHLRRGSLHCHVGQRVAAGAEIGRCGNSGNTTEPHVHIHMQDGPRPLDAEGLPIQFVDYVADGKPVARGEPVKGQVIRRAH